MHNVTKVMIKATIINFLLSLLQVVAGIVGNSSAVIADGVHTLSDFATDVVAIFGNKISHKRANNKHPYGYGEIEYLTSILIGTVVLAIGLILIYESMQNAPKVPNIIVIVVTLITLIAKFILSTYVLNTGYKANNAILIASGKESHADVISSFFVLASALISQLTRYNHVFIYTDRITAIIVGLFIVKVGFDIMAENISSIIGEHEQDIDINNSLKKVILSDKTIIDINTMILLKQGSYYKLIIDLVVDGNLILKQVYKLKKRLIKKIKHHDKKIRYITIEFKDN